MRSRGVPDSQVPTNSSFLDRWYQQGSIPENEDASWKVSPNKIIHEVSSEMSFAASTPELNKASSNSPIFSFKDQISTPTTDFVLPKVKSTTNAKVIPPASITPPRSARSSIKYSRQFEELIKEQQVQETMQEVSLIGAHVNDIRKRVRNYQPVSVGNPSRAQKQPDDVDRSVKIEGSSILALSRQVLKELKKDKQEEKLALQLKRLKKQNIDKMFEEIVFSIFFFGSFINL